MSRKKPKEPTGLANEFRLLGLTLIGHKTTGSIAIQDRRYRANFGVSWNVVGDVWRALNKVEATEGQFATKLQRKHLLWTLYFFKLYPTEDKATGDLKCSKKTFRHWTKVYIEKIAFLVPFLVSLFA